MSDMYNLSVTLPPSFSGDINEIQKNVQRFIDDQQRLDNERETESQRNLSPESSCQTKTLQDAMNDMVIERRSRKDWRANTAYKYTSQLQQIVTFLGASRAVSSLRERDIHDIRRALNTKAKNTKELTPAKGSYVNNVIGAETNERYFNILKRFLNYCQELGYLDTCLYKNSAQSPVSDDESKYKTFSHLEMTDIFSSRVFTTAPDTKIRWIPYSYCFWIPLLAAFTGARPGELCQLLVGDIHHQDGIPVIRITDEGPLQHLKNGVSRRTTPVHPQLLKIGLLDFLEMRRREGGKYHPLFPELSYTEKDGHARMASRWFSGQGAKDPGYIQHCDLRKGEGACLYSFRHTFINSLRSRGIQEVMIKLLVGHSVEEDVTIHYGNNFSLKQMADTVAEVRFDTDLSGVSWQRYHQLQQRYPQCQKIRRTT